jgi:beta-phosphoglucomutase-like phosphatase (HAD superfamily)
MIYIDNYDLFIFDLDDTLIKTEEYHYKIWLETLQKFIDPNFTFTYDFFCSKFHSKEENPIKNYIINELKLNNYNKIIEKKEKLFFEFINKEKKNIKLIDGVEEIINYIIKNNKQFVIVTNSPKNILNFFLGLFPILNSSTQNYYRELFTNKKPAPECYLKVINDFPNYKMIGFEDSITGIHSLYNANLLIPNDENKIDIVFINKSNYIHYNYIIENYSNIEVITNFYGIIEQCRLCENNDCESLL